MALKRSNIEFAKRVFLDRLTTDQEPLMQPADIDEGPGTEYDYGGCYDPYNFGIGADCSGLVGIMVAAAINGPDMKWTRYFSTETFPGPFRGFRQVSRNELLSGNSVIKVNIAHGGGGPNSHMQCWVDGWLMESNGDHGTCTEDHGAIPLDSTYWNDFWVLDDTITEDINYRQQMSYTQGVDYAGGRISGADLKAAGVAFVCRYLSDGGRQLPGKQLLPDEAQDLQNNGIQIVSNWETTANMMLGGYNQGKQDAQTASSWHKHCGGPDDAVIYFSCDFDAAENQQGVINDYLRACCDVLGSKDRVGIYGAYWVGMRALNADVCSYLWQTQAWSGGNVDSRVHIVQRNRAGYRYIGGVQCDINEAHRPSFGQWGALALLPPVPEAPAPEPVKPDYTVLGYEQLTGPCWPDGYGHGWAQLGDGLAAPIKARTIVDFLAKYKPLWDAQLEAAHVAPVTPGS